MRVVLGLSINCLDLAVFTDSAFPEHLLQQGTELGE